MEALARLGLTESAAANEIEDAYRTAIKIVHPDGSSPDAVAAVRLNEARAGALAGIDSPTGALVPVGTGTGVERVPNSALLNRPSHSEQALQSVVMHHVGLLARRKRTRTVLAAVSGAIAAFVGLLATLTKTSSTVPVVDGRLVAISVAAAVAGAAFGLLAIRAAFQEESLRFEIEQVADTLSDRGTFVATLDEMEVREFWSRPELQDAIRRWGRDRVAPRGLSTSLLHRLAARHRPAALAHTAHRIGAVDFAKLVMTQGIELGLIEEATRESPDGRTAYGYVRL